MNVPGKTFLSVLTLVFALSICENTCAQRKKERDNFILVIDPGHGGNHPGAVGGSLLEKDLNLAIAEKFGALVSGGMPDVKVLYTRTGDTNPSLAERGAFANRADADLFFSIHINATANSVANGASTWVMGMSKSENNLREAMRENEVIKFEDGYTETYEGFDPSSAESYIIFSLMQHAHFDRSLRFARIVQSHYAKSTALRDRGAAQGPFVVLWKAAMPSVLTEVGFISNESDRRYISSAAGQEKIAGALYDAFREYRALVGGPATTVPGAAVQTDSTAKTGCTVQTAAVSRDGVAAKTDSTAQNTPSTQNGPAAKSTPAIQNDPTAKSSPATHSGLATQTAPETQTGSASTSSPLPSVHFYIQIAASRTKIAANDSSLGRYRGRVVERTTDGWYKYMLGPCPTFDQAAEERREARKNGFRDAFIVKITE